MTVPTLFGDELLTRNIGQQQVITIGRPESIDKGIGYNRWWFQGYHPVHFPENLISSREKSEKIMQKSDFWWNRAHLKNTGDKRCWGWWKPTLRHHSPRLTIRSSDAAAVSSFCPSILRTKWGYTSSDIYPIVLPSYHQKNKDSDRLNSMLLITYRMPNITRGPKRAMTLTQTFLLFTPNHTVLDQSLYFLAFPLYLIVDSSRCWFVVIQNWRILLQNGNLLGELLSWIEESFFPCQLTWSSAQFSSFATILGYFPWSSLPWFHCALW